MVTSFRISWSGGITRFTRTQIGAMTSDRVNALFV
jgi:hypothetical protein